MAGPGGRSAQRREIVRSRSRHAWCSCAGRGETMKMFVYALLAGAMPFLCPIGSARADSVVEENAASAVFRAMRDDLERCFVSVTGNAFVMVEAVLDDRGRVRRASASGSSIRRWSVSGAGTRRTKTTAVSPSGFGAHVGTNGRVSFAARRSARVRIQRSAMRRSSRSVRRGLRPGGRLRRAASLSVRADRSAPAMDRRGDRRVEK